ncbi:uncharacterized protein LOC100578783 [Apis mellifera]|uniref:Uncharacterized protein LOC100578783 n=1 Tax=Apis mellifera TaxID=7460 RepID=A0A7M7G9V3_APIME|nr:uncharacterized protein LOC100578783 [Apis mellifera]|eukprot:XP_003249311.3 uncharacterized protein LOC100578783 [Apis mellifera]
MRCELTCRGIEDACSRVLGSFLIRFYLSQGKFKQSKRILIFIKYDLSFEIFIHFVKLDPINTTTNIINIPLNALLQPSPPPKNRARVGRRQDDASATTIVEASWNEQACTHSARGRAAAEAIARKQEGRGVSGPQRSRPRRNATAARINRSRDPGEFIRFVAASLKAARVSFASRSLLAVYGEGGVRGGPRVCIYVYIHVGTYSHRGGKEREAWRRRADRSTANRDMWPRIYVPREEKSPTGLFELASSSSSSSSSSLSRPFFHSSPLRCSLLRLFSFARPLVVSAMVPRMVGRVKREAKRPSGDESRQRLDNGESYLDKRARKRALKNIRIRGERERGPLSVVPPRHARLNR